MADSRSWWQRAWTLRAYWLLPVVIATALIAALVAFGGSGDSRPFVYPSH